MRRNNPKAALRENARFQEGRRQRKKNQKRKLMIQEVGNEEKKEY